MAEKLSSTRIADEDSLPISSTKFGAKRALDVSNFKDEKTVAHNEMMAALYKISDQLERIEIYMKEISEIEL